MIFSIWSENRCFFPLLSTDHRYEVAKGSTPHHTENFYKITWESLFVSHEILVIFRKFPWRIHGNWYMKTLHLVDFHGKTVGKIYNRPTVNRRDCDFVSDEAEFPHSCGPSSAFSIHAWRSDRLRLSKFHSNEPPSLIEMCVWKTRVHLIHWKSLNNINTLLTWIISVAWLWDS